MLEAIFPVISALSILVILGIGLFVYIRNQRQLLKGVFLILCISISVGIAANYYALALDNHQAILLMMRVVMAAAVVQSISTLLFVLIFPDAGTIKRVTWLGLIVIGLVTVGIAFSPLLFSGVSDSNIKVVPIVEPGVALFSIVTIGSLTYALFHGIRKVRALNGIVRQQLLYFVIGLMVMYLGILYFSFFRVVVYSDSKGVALMPFFALPFIISTGYALLRYRFMDVRVLIQRGAVYLLSLILTLGVYTYLALLLKNKIETSWDVNAATTTMVLILLVALGFPVIKIGIERIIQNVFGENKSIDLAVKELQEQVVEKGDAHELVEVIVSHVKAQLAVKSAVLLFIGREKKEFTTLDGAVSVPRQGDLVRYFESYDTVIVRDELPHMWEGQSGQFELEALQKLEREMKKAGFSLVAPFKTEDGLFCLLACGERASGEPYTTQDIEYLEKLRQQIGFTLASVLLYQKAMERIHGERQIANSL